MALSPGDDRVPVAARKTTFRRRGRRGALARALPRLAVLLAAFALFAQLLALPYHRAGAQPDLTSVAATLKATFGQSAVLCAQADDETSSTSPERRQGHCDDGCPLCQFAAQAALLVSPTPSLPARFDIAAAPLTARADFGWARPSPIRFAQPRAPPREV